MSDDLEYAERVWQSVDGAPPSSYTAHGLIRYADLQPSDPRWRDKLRLDLRTPMSYLDHSAYLSQLTLVPDHGVCAVPEVIALTAHTERFTRVAAIEVLMILVRDYVENVDPSAWVEVIRPRLDDDCPEVREHAETILRRAGVVILRPKRSLDDAGPADRRHGWPDRRAGRRKPGREEPR